MRCTLLLSMLAMAACGNELPETAPGNRIRGGLVLGASAEIPDLEQPAIRVIAFFNFPPGSAFSYTTIVAPDFSDGIVSYEIDRVVATDGYSVAATYVDLASTDFFPTAEEVLGYPAGAYPDVCKAIVRDPASLVTVTDELSAEDINMTLYPVFTVQDDVPVPLDPCLFGA